MPGARHSKNNTSNSIFTYHEKQKLGYGTKSQRIGKDSLTKFDHCNLTLHPVQDPVCTKDGYLYSKEAIYEYILAQKKEIARQTELYEQQQKRIQSEDAKKQDENKQKQIVAFDKSAHGVLTLAPPVEPAKKGADLQQERKKLACFWVPGVQQEAAPTLLDKPNPNVLCPMSGKPLKVKSLISLHFTPNKEETNEGLFLCPLTRKTLTNETGGAAFKKCGHVVSMAGLKMITDQRCPVCNKEFKQKDVIKLQTGGTGFAKESSLKQIQPKSFTPAAWV